MVAENINIQGSMGKYIDLAFQGEPIIVPCDNNQNLVVLSEAEYQELAKAKRNAEYLAMLDRGLADMRQGKGITKTMEELEAMAADE